jgi:hypothetical protein
MVFPWGASPPPPMVQTPFFNPYFAGGSAGLMNQASSYGFQGAPPGLPVFPLAPEPMACSPYFTTGSATSASESSGCGAGDSFTIPGVPFHRGVHTSHGFPHPVGGGEDDDGVFVAGLVEICEPPVPEDWVLGLPSAMGEES